MSLANIQPKRQEIQRNVFLYTYRITEPVTKFHFELECAKYQRIHCTINIKGSENIVFHNSLNDDEDSIDQPHHHPLQKSVTVAPFQRVTVGTLRLVDPTLSAQLKVGYALKVLKPQAQHISAAIQRDRDDIDVALHGSTYARLNFRNNLRDINMACVEHDINFVDATFPPSDASLVGPAADAMRSANAASSFEDDSSAEALVELISNASLNDAPNDTDFEESFLKQLQTLHGGVTWRRPEEFMGREHDLMRRANGAIGGGIPSISSSDIREGQLGDHWLISALACVAERPSLIHRLFQPAASAAASSTVTKTYARDQLNRNGAYVVCLCKNGERREVLVDDYLPCSPGGGPIFSRSNGDSLWVSLVEKAMAKLHGGYVYLKSSLKHRWTHEGLTDLTGAPTTNVRFEAYRNKKNSGDVASLESGLTSLWEDLQEYDAAEHLMCVTAMGEGQWGDEQKERLVASKARLRGDFVPAHSYTILHIHETALGERLLHLRNSWATLKWSGDWSRSSAKWTPEARDEVQIYAEAMDEEVADGGGVRVGGTFWVSLKDAVERFESLSCCRVGTNYTKVDKENDTVATTTTSTSTTSAKEQLGVWSECRVRGAFTTSDADAIARTNMYLLDVPADTENVMLVLHQNDQHIYGERAYVDIGLTLLSLTSDGQEYRMVPGGSTGSQVARQVVLDVGSISAGKYVIVPSSTKKRAAVETSDTQRVIRLTASLASGDKKEKTTHKLTPESIKAFTEIFERLDSDMDNLLNHSEINAFMVMSEGSEIDVNTLAWVVDKFGTDGVVTCEG